MAIDQAIELADHGLLFSHTNTCEERYNALAGQLQQHLAKYPTEYGVLAGDMFQVLFASRERGDSKVFKCFLLEYRNKSGWKSKEIELPQSSTVIAALGSGKPHFMKNYERYQAGLNNSTSRNVFHCFCDTIFSNADPLCGGAPQLVGLYRKPDSLPKQFGVIRNSCRYLNGMQITESPTFEGVEWRNDLFERCDGRTMLRLQDAQPQPDNLRTST
ncbi:hypothetical protein C2E31_18975 [Rhodopirellula baltica]|nr:hypothetical protein C2E31_18975 [Rhodopirellula baltica]